MKLSEGWVERCERILDRIKTLENSKDMDRLELIQSMGFNLGSLVGSLSGWFQWINNPDIMTRFNKEELEVINKGIIDFVKSFIEYDMKITKQAIQKGITETEERTVTRPTPDRLII